MPTLLYTYPGTITSIHSGPITPFVTLVKGAGDDFSSAVVTEVHITCHLECQNFLHREAPRNVLWLPELVTRIPLPGGVHAAVEFPFNFHIESQDIDLSKTYTQLTGARIPLVKPLRLCILPFHGGSTYHWWPEGASDDWAIHVSNLTVELTVVDTSVPTGGETSAYALEVTNKPYITSGSNISGNIEQVFKSNGHRDLAGKSTFKIEIVSPTAVNTPIAAAFSGGAALKNATLVSGVAAFSEPLNTSLAAGEYQYRVECTSNCIVNRAVLYSPKFYYKGSGVTTNKYLDFTTQPPATATVGTPLTDIVVKSVNDQGTVLTTATGACTVVNHIFGGSSKDASLFGDKVVEFSSGIAVFSNLVHVIPGRYFLKANATSHRENWSTVTNVGGEAPSAPGLRQMHSEDGDWRKTTGLAAPTFGSTTLDEQRLLDGDTAVTDKVTTDGVRVVFVKSMFLRKVTCKYKLSSLATAPTIKVYISSDSTDPESGTWTLLTTFTPASTKAEIKSFVPSSGVYTTGIWFTQDKNGGSSTCDWYSTQVAGDYILPDFSVAMGDGALDEEYISIPSPLKNLDGTVTEVRDIVVSNHTGDDKLAVVQVVPARYGGDDKITGEISVRNPLTNHIVRTMTFPAMSGEILRLQYSIIGADNDRSGLHYIKFKLVDLDPTVSYFWDVDASGTSWKLVNIATGSVIATIARLDVNGLGVTSVGTNDEYVYLNEITGLSQLMTIRRRVASDGTAVGTFTIQWDPGEGSAHNIIFILNDTMYFMRATVGTDYGVIIPNVSEIEDGAELTATDYATFDIPDGDFPSGSTQWIVIDSDAPTFVCKLTATNPEVLVSYSPDPVLSSQYWTVDAAHLTDANFGAAPSKAITYDSSTGRIWRFREVSGGLIGVESYTTPGGTIGTPVEADIYHTISSAVGEATRAFVIGTKMYVLLGQRYLWSYDLPAMNNATLVWDNGAALIFANGSPALFYF